MAKKKKAIETALVELPGSVVMRSVFVPLNSDEKRQRGEELAGVVEKIAIEKGRAEDDRKLHKEEVDRLAKEEKRLAASIRRGDEERMVECLIEKDDEGLQVRYVRRDNGDVVGERAMTEVEVEAARQTGLPLDHEATPEPVPGTAAVGLVEETGDDDPGYV